MTTLTIEVAENGFLAFDDSNPGMIGKKWAFESAGTLAEFIKKWGIENTIPPAAPPTKAAPGQQ